jgi:hypothetical protein
MNPKKFDDGGAGLASTTFVATAGFDSSTFGAALAATGAALGATGAGSDGLPPMNPKKFDDGGAGLASTTFVATAGFDSSTFGAALAATGAALDSSLALEDAARATFGSLCKKFNIPKNCCEGAASVASEDSTGRTVFGGGVLTTFEGVLSTLDGLLTSASFTPNDKKLFAIACCAFKISNFSLSFY